MNAWLIYAPTSNRSYESVAAQKKRKLMAFMGGPQAAAQVGTHPIEVVDEWQVYMQLPQENFDPDLNVMAWWRDRQLLFPTLSKMARQFLSCPATSAGKALRCDCRMLEDTA
jgi:hypothetical protein